MANLPNKFVKICKNIIWANFLCLACLVLQNIINQNLQTYLSTKYILNQLMKHSGVNGIQRTVLVPQSNIFLAVFRLN